MSHVTFTLGCNANLDVGGNTTEFRLAGKWLKIFNVSPNLNDTTEAGKYISFSSANQSPELSIQTGGYTGVSIHSSFAKSVYSCVAGTNSLTITPTNILWPIQIVCNPSTYFTNMNTAAKVSYFMPIMEEIEIISLIFGVISSLILLSFKLY